jgi:uncharacterized protein (TIGR00255 family)
MKSMTGFGERIVDNQRYRISATIRAVNHRFLDLVVRIPEEYRALESDTAKMIRKKLVRGRVEVRIGVEALVERPFEIEVRKDVLRELTARLEDLREEGLVEGRVDVSDVVRFPQVLTVRERPPGWTEEDADLVREAVAGALAQVAEARQHEGEKLSSVLLSKVDQLAELVGRLEARRQEVKGEILGALKERLEELVSSDGIPEERLAQEVVFLVERSDVREELDRLAAHLDHFRSLGAGKGPHGRRLEFLVQEIQRELNTLGGKCRDSEMSRDCVEGKLLCEQLREQLLNVE